MQKTNFSFEILIYDDASIDKTQEIIKELAFNNKEIITFLQTENQWQQKRYGLLEWLFPAANGKYIAMCEGDDYWTDPLKLQEQVDFLEANPEYAIHCGHARILSDDPGLNGCKIHEEIQEDTILAVEDFAENSRIVTCTAMIRNIGLRKLPSGFFNATAGDLYLWVYLLQITKGKVFYRNKVFAAYRAHAAGIYSGLNTLGRMLFYETNLKAISKLFNSRDLKRKSASKRNWYLEQIFRVYLDQKQNRKAFSVLVDLLIHGYPLKSLWNLILEWKNSFGNRST